MSSAFRVSSLALSSSLSSLAESFRRLNHHRIESDLRTVVEKYFALYAGKDLTD